jgi:hypothetical protein
VGGGAGPLPPATTPLVVLEAQERAVRMARAELQLEQSARCVAPPAHGCRTHTHNAPHRLLQWSVGQWLVGGACLTVSGCWSRSAAEQRAAEMSLRALEAEREAREEAARRVLAEERAAERAQCVTTDRKNRRNAAATGIQRTWRGYWQRKCMAIGLKQLEVYVKRMQAVWRGSKARGEFRAAVRKELQQREHHVCLGRHHQPSTATTRPRASLRRVEFGAGDGTLGFAFDSKLRVVEVDTDSMGEAAGVQVGWQLVLLQGQSVSGCSFDQVSGRPVLTATQCLLGSHSRR